MSCSADLHVHADAIREPTAPCSPSSLHPWQLSQGASAQLALPASPVQTAIQIKDTPCACVHFAAEQTRTHLLPSCADDQRKIRYNLLGFCCAGLRLCSSRFAGCSSGRFCCCGFLLYVSSFGFLVLQVRNCRFTLLFLLLTAIADRPHRDADAGASFVHSSAADLRWCVDFGVSLCQSSQTSL